MLKPRGGYSGPAELLAGDVTVGKVDVELRGYVEVHQVPAGGGARAAEGFASCDGQVAGGGSVDLAGLFGEIVTVHTPDGRQNRAVVVDANGRMLGAGPAPFDITRLGVSSGNDAALANETAPAAGQACARTGRGPGVPRRRDDRRAPSAGGGIGRC